MDDETEIPEEDLPEGMSIVEEEVDVETDVIDPLAPLVEEEVISPLLAEKDDSEDDVDTDDAEADVREYIEENMSGDWEY